MRESSIEEVTTKQVQNFWEKNPLCASLIPHPLGSKEFFLYYDSLREGIESIKYSYRLHEYQKFKGKNVLDVGCGNGYVLSKYALEGAKVSGIDITQVGIDLCKQRFKHQGLKGEFQVGDAQELPFEDNFFDCVCSMGVLHHVPDTNKAVAEIFRVLKPGGRLIVMFYHRNSAKYLRKFRKLSQKTGKSRQQLVNEFDGAGNPKGMVYSKSELAETLKDFDELKMFVGFLDPRDLVPKWAKKIPNFVFRPLAPFWDGIFMQKRGNLGSAIK